MKARIIKKKKLLKITFQIIAKLLSELFVVREEEILETIRRIIFIYIFRFAGTVIATTIIARPGLSLLSNITLHQGNCIYDLAQPRIQPEKCRWRTYL